MYSVLRFRSPGIWRSVAGYIVPNVSMDRGTLVFKVQLEFFLIHSPLEMKAPLSFETLGSTHPTTEGHIQGNPNRQQFLFNDVKFAVNYFVSISFPNKFLSVEV
jgi:hypothetical protein